MKAGCDSNDDATAEFDDPAVAVVLRGNLSDLQRAGDRLEQHGIDAAVVRPPGDVAKGCCSTTVYLVVARENAEAALSVFNSDWRRGMSDEQVAAHEAASRVVIDPDAAETTCPACLTTFATGPAECPDCGLAIG
ncbi:MAG: hypothetical protein ABR587_14225 [Candidatus Binatia bacterium]